MLIKEGDYVNTTSEDLKGKLGELGATQQEISDGKDHLIKVLNEYCHALKR